MSYIWLKALHVIAVLVWTGGLLAQSLILRNLSGSPSDRSTPLVSDFRRWDSLITSPALLLVWGLGIFLAMLSESFNDAWLMAKLALVLFLSALHGVQAGMIRKAVVSGTAPVRWTRWSPFISCAAVAGIALLAVAKPF